MTYSLLLLSMLASPRFVATDEPTFKGKAALPTRERDNSKCSDKRSRHPYFALACDEIIGALLSSNITNSQFTKTSFIYVV